MNRHTIPGYSEKIRGAMSETKYQSRIRNDLHATGRHYKRRVHIDRHNENKALQAQLREPYDD